MVPNGTVHALTVPGNTLHVVPNRVFGILPWNPQPDNNVLVMALLGNKMYLGGDFSLLARPTAEVWHGPCAYRRAGRLNMR